MKSWPKAKLGDIATITAGQSAPQSPSDYGTEGISFVKAGHLSKIIDDCNENSCLKISDERAKFYKLKLFSAGSIIFAKSGMSCMKGFVHLLTRDVYLVNHLACVTSEPSELFPGYLRYYLMKRKPNALVKDESYPSISLTDIAKITIPLPPLAEQEKIARTLDVVSASQRSRRRYLDELETLIRARFIETFGNPSSSVQKWPTRRLGDVCKINPSKSASLAKEAAALPVSFVPMPNVSERGEIDASETRLYEEVKKGFTYFEENDVLFAKITPCMENGKGAVARGLTNGVGFGSTEFHVLRPMENAAHPVWIYRLTAFQEFRRLAQKKMTGSAGQKRVPASFLENFVVGVPPIALQNEFATFVESVERTKAAVRAGIAETQTLFDALTQEYFG